jgi:hypothetical protein
METLVLRGRQCTIRHIISTSSKNGDKLALAEAMACGAESRQLTLHHLCRQQYQDMDPLGLSCVLDHGALERH